MSSFLQGFDRSAKKHCIRYVDKIASGDQVLLRFKDPSTCYAVLTQGIPSVDEVAADTLNVVLLPLEGAAEWPSEANDPDAPPPIYIKYRGVELLWRRGYAWLRCDAEQVESLLAAVVEFAHYERELRRIEDEIEEAWQDLEEDRPLTFDVTPAGLSRSQVIGGRMDRTLRRRMRLARMEPRLYSPDTNLSAASQKLGEELREKTGTETRAEIVDGQIEVFEHIYEMASQRMGEYRASRKEHIMEWVIVVILAAEALLMLAQTLGRVRT